MSNLTARDLTMFGCIKVGPELLSLAKIERLSDEQARELLALNGRTGDMSGIVFPYPSPRTGRRVTARLRRDNPEIEDGQEKNKYLAPYGDRRHLYFPPGSAELLADTSVPIVLVEAEKSSLALLAWSQRTGNRVLPIGMGGCWGWRGRIGKVENSNGERVDETGPLPELRLCAQRLTYVLLDANCTTNPKVEWARQALVKELKRLGADVRILDLPGGEGVNGPDDFLAVRDDEALLALFERAKPTVPPVAEPVSYVRHDMPDSALDGSLGEICQTRLKSFPLAYSWGALVTAAGALMPRQKHALRTNLYYCPVGPTASGKSTSTENAFRVLGMWDQHPVLLKAKFGSAEALVERLKDVEAGSQRVVYVDELAHLLAKAAIDRSSFPYILNTAYYQDAQTGGSKGHPFDLDCRLSLVGGIVEERFGDCFGAETTGGLYDRFIFGLCPQPFEYLWRPLEGESEKLRPSPALVDEEVWDVRDEWVKNGIAPRVAEHALRVAYICASVDCRPTLRAVELEPAFAFAQYQMRVRRVLAPNPGENPDARCAVAVRAWLKEHAPNGTWVARRDLDRGINSSRLGPGVFNRCLNNLFFNGEIELDEPNRKILRLVG